MPILKIKRLGVLLVFFLTSYFNFGFISFASILIIFCLYRLQCAQLNIGDIRAVGIPALTVIFLLGLVSTAAISPYTLSTWNIGKDLYFFLAPIMMLILGLTFMNNFFDFENFLKTSAMTLTIISILQFSDFLFGAGLFNASLDARYEYGLDSTASTLALIVIISLRPTLKSLIGSTQLSVAAVVNILLILASLSRVNIGISFISLVFVFSHSRLLRASIFVAILILISTPLLQIPMIFPQGTLGDSASFFNKVLNSLQDIRMSNYFEMSDINENWRGYEAFLGVDKVLSVGGWATLIGLGFGSFVEGPFSGKLEQIPFFHNGFITIFFKSGALGIFIFSLFVAKLYLTSRAAILHGRSTSNPRIVNAGILLFLLISSVLFRTLATHGVYYSRPPLELFFIGLTIYVIRNSQWKNLMASRLHKEERNFLGRMLPKMGPL